LKSISNASRTVSLFVEQQTPVMLPPHSIEKTGI
jgi:hypothetical protein